MGNHTVLVTLPETLYQQVRISAEAAAQPIEDLLSQFIATTYPVIDDDLPLEMRSEFAGWLLLSDANLWEIAKSRFDEAKQDKLAELVELQKQRPLIKHEQRQLDQLLRESQELMLRKAEAQRVLAQRGIRVYPKSNALN
ncbi:MAG: hypothetical protein DYG89_36280 [Caldilinea sp. CFX5]|nr:hypothetical protein [Caldilinea sp. CFX5]